MAKYIVEEQTLTDIADAIREQTGDENPIMLSNFANEISSIQGGGSVNYSTTEHEVGTWIDGSTVYEKTFSFNNQSYSGSVNVSVTLPSMNKMWIENAWCVNSENAFLPLPYVHSDNSNSIGIFINVASQYIGLRMGNNAHPITDLYVTIRYTKSAQEVSP